MFDIKTPLCKIHRVVRHCVDGVVAKPGLWIWIDNNGFANTVVNVPSGFPQPKVLKPVFGKIGSSRYETNDSYPSRRISTLEFLFRAGTDTSGYQKYDTQAIPQPIAYVPGMKLTVACRVATAASTDLNFSAAADLGKLKPAVDGDVAVAVFENFDFGVFVYKTISPEIVSNALEFFWRGAGNWSDPTKWANTVDGPKTAGVPGSGATVVFDGVSSSCVLDVDTSINHLNMEGYTQTLSGSSKTIQVAGNLSLDGSSDVNIKINNNGVNTIQQNGSQNVKITIESLTTGSILQILESLNVGQLRQYLNAACHGASLVVADGQTVIVNTFAANGTGSYQLFLRSANGGPWYLKATTITAADALHIANTDASHGTTLYATNSSSGGGNNGVELVNTATGNETISTVKASGSGTDAAGGPPAGYDIGAYQYHA